MSYSINHISPSLDIGSFKPSRITVIEGSSGMIPGVLFHLCAASIISLGRDAMFVDGCNSFNPYTVSKIVRSSGAHPKKVLSRIHVARAFTEYQMDALIDGLREAIDNWTPAVLAVSYLPSLFSGADGRRLLGPLLERLKALTSSSDIITAITSFGGSWYGDRLLAGYASRIVRIEHPSKKIIRIIDNGLVTEYMPVPAGQMRFSDFMVSTDPSYFTGGDAYGQDCPQLSQPA